MPQDIKKSLLITLDFPPNLGGVATYYYNVCKNLPPDKIVVLAPKQEGDAEFDKKQNFPIIRKNLINQFPNFNSRSIDGIFKIASTVKWLSLIKYFKPIIKSHQIELIQAGQVLPIGTLAMFYKRKNQIPYIFYAHGLDILLPQKFKRKKTMLKQIIKEAEAIVANSYFTKDELIKLGADSQKIIVVYPCPNLEIESVSEWKTEKILEEHALKDKKIILTVGRLVERKGHDMVIRALPKIIQAIPEVLYLIVGTGPNKENLEKLVNLLGLRDYVKFLGVTDQNDLAAYYQICDVFLMPSRQLTNGDVEGFGIVYLEANLFGKPVIGGKSGGVPEAIIDEKTGLLVNPTDINEIAQKTIGLLTDQAYAQRLGLQGLQRVTEEFDWPSQTEKIKAILH